MSKSPAERARDLADDLKHRDACELQCGIGDDGEPVYEFISFTIGAIDVIETHIKAAIKADREERGV